MALAAIPLMIANVTSWPIEANAVTYELTLFIGLANIAWWFVSLAMYRVELDTN